MARRPRRLVGAGTLHLHVHLDGEVRRRLWRAHRHPCRRRRARQPAAAAVAQAGDPVRPAVRRVLHRHRSPTFGGSFVGEMFETGQQSNDLEAPMWIVYLAIPLGSGLMCFRFLQVAWWYYWTGELPHHNEAHVEGIDADRAGAAPGAERDRPTAPSRRSSPLGTDPDPGADPDLWRSASATRPASSCCRRRCARSSIFVLLIALMLTGMPVSIALGLTVLTFLFTLTDVPIEAVSMKLFTGIEKLRDHGDPVLHPGRQFPHPWRRRAADDRFRDLAGRALAWRAGARRHRGLRDVRAGLRIERRHRRRDRRHRAAGDGAARLSDALRRRHHHGRRLARHPDAAVDPEDHLRGLHQHLDRRAVRRRPAARHRC